MLFDDAIDRRQPKAGALADFLGGEERLEYPLQILRRYARARVAHRQTHKLPGPRFVIGLRVSLGHARPFSGNEQLTAIRHGVPPVDHQV